MQICEYACVVACGADRQTGSGSGAVKRQFFGFLSVPPWYMFRFDSFEVGGGGAE